LKDFSVENRGMLEHADPAFPRICFTILSSPGTQRLLQLRTREVQILLKLVEDFGFVHLVLVLQVCTM
jgi:hypothetical protein